MPVGSFSFFFFMRTATTHIYTLSLHDALPIFERAVREAGPDDLVLVAGKGHERQQETAGAQMRSEEHTSELQSRQYLVCRLLLEKKKGKPSEQRSQGGQRTRAGKRDPGLCNRI